jgi:hypothetical protein
VSRWLAAANARRDPATGLLPHTADPGSGARATSQVIILRFLPEIDPIGAARDWRLFKERFGSHIVGIPGIREYPIGAGGAGDVDSGPLPLGLSLSASAVALGDAVVYGDRRAASALTGLAEATGLPVEWGGRRRYAAGVLPIGDAFLAWSMTAVPRGQTDSTWPGWYWRVPWYAVAYLVCLVLAIGSARGATRGSSGRTSRRRGCQASGPTSASIASSSSRPATVERACSTTGARKMSGPGVPAYAET